MNDSDLFLDPDIKRRLEQTLGIDIPDPNTSDFQTLLEDLQENQPELFEDVMRGLSVNVTFPAEQQAQRAAQRETFSELLSRLVYRRSRVDGEPVAAKRRWLMYLFTALALLGPGVYFIGQAFGNRAPAQVAEAEPLAPQEPTVPEQPSTQLTSMQPPAPELVSDEPEIPPPAAPAPPKTNPLPPAPAPAPKVTPPAPAPAATPQVKEVAEVLPTTLTMYDKDIALPQQLSLYDREKTEEEVAANLTLYEDEASSDALLIAETEEQAAETLMLPISENPNAVTRPESLQLGEMEDDSSTSDLPLTLPMTANASDTEEIAMAEEVAQTDDEGMNEAIDEETNLQTLEDILPPGSRITATLETGIVLTEGSSAPVVAKSGSEWCTAPPCPEITWIGEAFLGGTNRVQIQFSQAVYEKNVQTVSALALGAGSVPGLTASIKDAAPTVAQDLLRSAVGGVSEYLNILTQQRKVTVIDGVAVSESEMPPLDLFLLGQMGSVFNVPDNTTSVVRLAEVPAASPLVVLFGITGGGVEQAPSE
jgi:hypothetical protein